MHPGVTPPTYLAFHLLYLSSGFALQLLLINGKVFRVEGGYLLMQSYLKESALLVLFLLLLCRFYSWLIFTAAEHKGWQE